MIREGRKVRTVLVASALIWVVSASWTMPALAVGPGVWGSVGVLAGATQPDSDLSDYRWDVTGQRGFGAQGLVGFGPVGAGIRYWKTQTHQSTGLLGVEIEPEVRMVSVEAMAQLRLFSVAGFQFAATGSYGQLQLSYKPATLTVDPGTGTLTEIEFRPIDTWTASAGLALRRAILPGIGLGLQVDRSFFELDVLHRAGSEIVGTEEGFGHWNARLELAWLIGLF